MRRLSDISLRVKPELAQALLSHKIYGDLPKDYLLMRANEVTKHRLSIVDKATAIAVLIHADKVNQWSPPWYKRYSRKITTGI